MHHAPEVLTREGHKLTPQRLLIWHILAAGGHLTAAQIHEKVNERFPGVDLATVYRTLELLARLGLVQESTYSSGPSQYEATEDLGHDHLICRKCGNVEHYDGTELTDLAGKIVKNKGFDASLTEISISSICKTCADGI